MKFVSTVTLLAAPFAISATHVSWDFVYDQGTQSLSTVACSDGSNGLLTKGYNVFDDLPTFPNIGGSSVVASWNSPSCGWSLLAFRFISNVDGSLWVTGSCWNITYQGETITVTVIDSASDGFNLSEEAMNTLTCVGSLAPSLYCSLTCSIPQRRASRGVGRGRCDQRSSRRVALWFGVAEPSGHD